MNTGTVLLGRKTTTLLLEIVMVGLLLLLALHAIVGRQVPSSEHFSQVVQVAVEEKEEDGEVRLVVGNLKLHLGRRAGEHLLGRVLVQEVPGQPGLVNISSLSVRFSQRPSICLESLCTPAIWKENQSARRTPSSRTTR